MTHDVSDHPMTKLRLAGIVASAILAVALGALLLANTFDGARVPMIVAECFLVAGLAILLPVAIRNRLAPFMAVFVAAASLIPSLVPDDDDEGIGSSLAAGRTLDAGSSRVDLSLRTVTTDSVIADLIMKGVTDFRVGESRYDSTISKQVPAEVEGGPFSYSLNTEDIYTGTNCYSRLPPFALRLVDEARQRDKQGGDPLTGLSQRDIQAFDYLFSQYDRDQVRHFTASKPWIKLDKAKVPTLDADASGNSGITETIGPIDQILKRLLSDPSRVLDFLEATASLAEVGDEILFGTQVTHYAGAIDLPATGAAEIPTEVWVDEDSLVRRISLKISSPGATTAVTMDLFDFGVRDKIDLPPENKVLYLAGPHLC
jgi:hypothetical protein